MDLMGFNHYKWRFDGDLFALHGNYGRRCQRFFGDVFRIGFGIFLGICLGYYMDAKPASWYKRCQRWDITRKKLMGYEWDIFWGCEWTENGTSD